MTCLSRPCLTVYHHIKFLIALSGTCLLAFDSVYIPSPGNNFFLMFHLPHKQLTSLRLKVLPGSLLLLMMHRYAFCLVFRCLRMLPFVSLVFVFSRQFSSRSRVVPKCSAVLFKHTWMKRGSNKCLFLISHKTDLLVLFTDARKKIQSYVVQKCRYVIELCK